MEFGVFGGLIALAFSLILSLNSPVYQVKMLALFCFALRVVGGPKYLGGCGGMLPGENFLISMFKSILVHLKRAILLEQA